MRLEDAIDRFLEHMQLENDASPETVRHYRDCLYKLADDYPRAAVSDFDGRAGYDKLIEFLGRRWGRTAASTRAKQISILHSFFAWLTQRWLIDSDPAARIQRPKKKQPNIYRPSPAELDLVVAASSIEAFERAPIVAMRGAGFRNSTVRNSRWQDWNLTEGLVRALVKGGNWIERPISPATLELMREAYRVLEPEPSHYLWPSQMLRFSRPGHVERFVRDLEKPGSPQSLMRMLERVCERAGVRRLHPHLLRHGFANGLDADDLDLRTIQFLMGHAHAQTTEGYLDKRRLDDAAAKLDAAHKRRLTMQHPHDDTTDSLEGQESGWRESNPRTNPPSAGSLRDENSLASEEHLNAPKEGHNVGKPRGLDGGRRDR